MTAKSREKRRQLEWSGFLEHRRRGDWPSDPRSYKLLSWIYVTNIRELTHGDLRSREHFLHRAIYAIDEGRKVGPIYAKYKRDVY